MIAAARFAGDWRLEREIEDRRAGQVLRGTGRARFDGAGPALHYREELELTVPGAAAPLRGERGYLWRFGAGRVRVFFEDGRPFHDFVPEGQGEGTAHPCGADLYRVIYDFTAFPRWEAVWTVTGPRKDYVSRTIYRPHP